MFAFLWGCVTIQIQGTGVDKWLRCAQNEGIVLGRMQRRRYACLVCEVSLRDLEKAYALCPDGAEITELARRGISCLLRAALREAPLLVSVLCAFLFVLWAYGKIWRVQVEGTDPVLSGRIQSYLTSRGITGGMNIAELDVRQLETSLLLAFPELRFAQVERVGTYLSVTPVPLSDTPTCDVPAEAWPLVASHAGVVEQVTVASGTAAVESGDEVVPGQVLIEGVTSPTPDLMEPRAVTAQGSVTARVWFAGAAGSVDLPQEVHTSAQNRWALRLGDWTLPLFWDRGETPVPAGSYALAGPWRKSPVELIRYCVFEKEKRTDPKDAHYAYLAQKSARQALENIPPSAQILSLTETTHRDEDGNWTVQTLIEARMDIAVYPAGE